MTEVMEEYMDTGGVQVYKNWENCTGLILDTIKNALVQNGWSQAFNQNGTPESVLHCTLKYFGLR